MILGATSLGSVGAQLGSGPLSWSFGAIVCLEDVVASVASLSDVDSQSAMLSDVQQVEC